MLADMEAGLEHLSWAGGTLRHVDMLLIVVQPTVKVLLAAERTYALAVDLGIPDIAFVATRSGPDDPDQMRTFADERGCELLAAIPDDEAVREADRLGRCVLDAAPDSSCVRGIEQLADQLAARFPAEPGARGAVVANREPRRNSRLGYSS